MPYRSNSMETDRRRLILDAALHVIARRGVAGASHRVIAAEANVPLGSMTYYFNGLQDLLHQAFDQHARQSAAAFARRFASASDTDQALLAIEFELGGADIASADELRLNLEFCALAARDDAFRDIAERWESVRRRCLSRFFDPATVTLIEAFYTGIMSQRAFTGEQPDADTLRLGLRRITG